MCLPTCARPDDPPCYKVPRSLTSPTQYESYHNQTSDSKAHDTTDFCHECDMLSDAFDDLRDEDNDLSHDQAKLRREKSRVAAKLRRQKENQALVKLRLALPIQPSSKISTGSIKESTSPQDTHRSTNCTTNAHSHHHPRHQHTKSYELTECDLSCIPNYRAANSISRKHHIAAPEFEKAVTVRLAGNALCLYDWLYTVPSQIGSTTLDYPNRNYSCCCASRIYHPPSLSLFSQSLIGIVVDTTENTVVYAPPAYAQMIGISWNTIIGLRLHEVRFKQFSSSISSQLINMQLNKTRAADETSPSLQSASSRSCPSSPSKQQHQQQQQQREISPVSSSPEPVANGSITDSGTMSTTADSPKSRHRTRKALSRSKRMSRCSLHLIQQPAFYAELWQKTDPYAASTTLTTLLPPGPNAAQLLGQLVDESSEQSSGTCVMESGEQLSTAAIRQSLLEGPEMFAVCWATMTLPAHATSSHSSVRTTRHCPISNLRNDASGYPTTASSTLRICLLNPISLQNSAFETSSIGLLRANSDPYRLTGPDALSNIGFAPQTCHDPKDLTFLNAQSQFLNVLDYTHEKLVGRSLLDFIHPDDLDTVSTTVGSITDLQPIITSFYRIRTRSGHYRWSRLIGMLCRRPADQPDVTHHKLPVDTQDSLHSLLPNTYPPPISDALRSWIVLWHQFAHFNCTGKSVGLSTEVECSKELPVRVSNRVSVNGMYTARSLQYASNHQELFPSPGCDPRRSTVSNSNDVRSRLTGLGVNPGVCCTCRIPRRCGACGTINSFPIDTPPASEIISSYTPLGSRQASTFKSTSSLPSITTSRDILCSLNNLSTYGYAGDGDIDTWDMDGVIPAEDALINCCSRPMSDSKEPMLLHNSTDCASILSSSNRDFGLDELKRPGLPRDSMVPMIQYIEASKIDWARQAPSINPDFGEVDLPGDTQTFCSNRRIESSAPSSMDADSFVLTPNLDLEPHSSLPSQQSAASGLSWTADDSVPSVPQVGASTPSRSRNYLDVHSDSHHSFLLPQAEIYAVPPGYYHTLDRQIHIDEFSNLPKECVVKRKRYAIESLDDPTYPSPITTATPDHLPTEMERLADSSGAYRAMELSVDSTLDSIDFSIPVTTYSSNHCRSPFLDLDSKSATATSWDRPFYHHHHSNGLPTLRRLLCNQMGETNFAPSCQVIHP